MTPRRPGDQGGGSRRTSERGHARSTCQACRAYGLRRQVRQPSRSPGLPRGCRLPPPPRPRPRALQLRLRKCVRRATTRRCVQRLAHASSEQSASGSSVEHARSAVSTSRSELVRPCGCLATVKKCMSDRVLVYLDTAHLDAVERLMESPVDARQFFERWNSARYELAVSYHHVEEIAQLRSATSINRRLSTLWEFPRLRYAQPGSGRVWAEEIRRQLLYLAGDETTPRYDRIRDAFFQRANPECIRRDLFSALERFRKGRAIHEAAATMDDLFAKVPAALRAAGIVPKLPRNSKFTPELAAQWVEHIRANQFPAPVNVLAGADDRILEALSEKVSVREAMERYHNLCGIGAAGIAPDADLGDLGVFFFLARAIAREMDRDTGSDGRFSALVPRLDPYDCPAFRMRLAVLRGRRASTNPAKPGDMIDADHLVFAAHVDLALVDKRTLHFLQSESRRRPALLPQAAIEHIRRSSLASLFSLH
jgi:hypothetical protein